MEELDEYNKLLLENFRKQWQNEISGTQSQHASHENNQNRDSIQHFQQNQSNVSPEDKTHKETAISHSGQGSQSNQVDISYAGDGNYKEITARNLYMLAVKYEQSGEVVEAVKWYKKALQLNPDIEQQIYAETRKEISGELVKNFSAIKLSDDSHSEELSAEDAKGDLFSRFLSSIHQDGRTCFPLEEPKGTHISALPHEVLIYIFKWVVSSDLDLRSLEQVSMVCRGLYVCSRDVEIWKQVCYRTWGETTNPALLGYNNFRDMYMKRPHPWFHGCYISKASYVRRGENSFQDIDYQPWHLVSYYRYLRFYADGVVLMLTTADDPATVVAQIQRKKRHVMQGQYILSGKAVNLVFRRKAKPPENTNQFRRRKRNEINVSTGQMIEQIFRIELEIGSAKKKLHGILRWVNYSIETVYMGKDPVMSDMDLNPTKFPPYSFSRVRSYNAESELPL